MAIGPEGARDFETVETEIVRKTKEVFAPYYPVHWLGLETLKNAIAILLQEHADMPEDLHKKIILMLVNRSIQHIEAVRLIVERGLYGDAFSLMRNIMSDISMLQYLHHHPELWEMFWNEKEDDYSQNKGFKKAFNETAIENDLIGRGLKPFTRAFRMMSKTSHASAFGSQLYGSDGDSKEKYNFTYGPRFQLKKALLFMDLIASCHYDILAQILAYQEQKGNGKVPGTWKTTEQDTLKLFDQVEHLSKGTKMILAKTWPDEITSDFPESK